MYFFLFRLQDLLYSGSYEGMIKRKQMANPILVNSEITTFTEFSFKDILPLQALLLTGMGFSIAIYVAEKYVSYRMSKNPQDCLKLAEKEKIRRNGILLKVSWKAVGGGRFNNKNMSSDILL